jgi:hypothetical protein
MGRVPRRAVAVASFSLVVTALIAPSQADPGNGQGYPPGPNPHLGTVERCLHPGQGVPKACQP